MDEGCSRSFSVELSSQAAELYRVILGRHTIEYRGGLTSDCPWSMYLVREIPREQQQHFTGRRMEDAHNNRLDRVLINFNRQVINF